MTREVEPLSLDLSAIELRTQENVTVLVQASIVDTGPTSPGSVRVAVNFGGGKCTVTISLIDLWWQSNGTCASDFAGAAVKQGSEKSLKD